MLRKTSRSLAVAMLLAAASLPGAAAASSFTTLYSFLGGPDGGYPFGEDVSPHGKFLFGTANGGGASLDGTVYRLNTATGAETVLYTFTGAADGCHPESPLTYSNGLYYGTTSGCGAGGHGTVFSVDPKSGAFKTLYGFTLGADGGFPSGSLLAFGGYLWGITQFGGANAAGTLFRIDPATGAEKVAYSFGKGAGAAYPDAGLVEHNGFLFGTTQSGGTNNGGTVFSYHPATGKVRVLHSFGSFGGADGYYPACELLLDGHELYGTTQNGGANSQGTIFKVDIGTGNETVLYSFTGGADGAFPYNALTPLKGDKASGKFYGIATGGGTNFVGTIFLYDVTSNTLTPEYSFTGGTDGGFPYSALTAQKGVLYSNTSAGGAAGAGTAFAFTP